MFNLNVKTYFLEFCTSCSFIFNPPNQFAYMLLSYCVIYLMIMWMCEDDMNFWNIMMYEVVIMMTLLMDMCVVYWWYNVWDLFNCDLRMMNILSRENPFKVYVLWCALMQGLRNGSYPNTINHSYSCKGEWIMSWE